LYFVSFLVFVIFQTVCLRLFEGNLLSVTFSADRQTLSCSSYDSHYLLTDSAKGDKTALMGKATNLNWLVQTDEPTKSVSSQFTPPSIILLSWCSSLYLAVKWPDSRATVSLAVSSYLHRYRPINCPPHRTTAVETTGNTVNLLFLFI
jgi:hypothetical protein